MGRKGDPTSDVTRVDHRHLSKFIPNTKESSSTNVKSAAVCTLARSLEAQYSFIAVVRLRRNKSSISGVVSIPQALIAGIGLKHGDGIELGVMQVIRPKGVEKE